MEARHCEAVPLKARLCEAESMEARHREAVPRKARYRKADSLKARQVETGHGKTRHQAADSPNGVSPWRLVKHVGYDSPRPEWRLRQLSAGESPSPASSGAPARAGVWRHEFSKDDPESASSDDQDQESTLSSSSSDPEALSHYHQGPMARSRHLPSWPSASRGNPHLPRRVPLPVPTQLPRIFTTSMPQQCERPRPPRGPSLPAWSWTHPTPQVSWGISPWTTTRGQMPPAGHGHGRREEC